MTPGAAVALRKPWRTCCSDSRHRRRHACCILLLRSSPSRNWEKFCEMLSNTLLRDASSPARNACARRPQLSARYASPLRLCVFKGLSGVCSALLHITSCSLLQFLPVRTRV